MRTRENEQLENSKFLHEMDMRLNQKQLEQIQKKQQERAEFAQQLDRYRKQGELNRMKKVALSESIYNELLGDAFKAIYITSLGPISERAESIANDCVDTYIKEAGGARLIMKKNQGKTYLLDTLFEIVQEAHDKELNRILKEEAFLEAEQKKAKDLSEDDGESDLDAAIKAAEEEDTSNDAEEDFKAAPDSDDNGGEVNADMDTDSTNSDSSNSDSNSNAEKEVKEEPVDTTDNNIDNTLDELEDDSVADGDFDSDAENKAEEQQEDEEEGSDNSAAEDARNDVVEDQLSDEEMNSKEDMFKQLEDEDEVHQAIDIIGQRIQDAESEFIRKNADDKQKIEKIVDKLSTRIKGATEDPSEDVGLGDSNIDNSVNEKLNMEAAVAIRNVRNRGHKSVFEHMVMDNSTHILKSQILREDYIENGKLDVAGVLETSRVTYGFLEFVNTIQLERVDEKFIKQYLDK